MSPHWYWLCCLQFKTRGSEAQQWRWVSLYCSLPWHAVFREEQLYIIFCTLHYSVACVCFWHLPWKTLLSVRKWRRYCGSPFLFTTQELMVRRGGGGGGGGTEEDEQLGDLWRRRELNCVVQTFCSNWMDLKGNLIKYKIYIKKNNCFLSCAISQLTNLLANSTRCSLKDRN